LVVENRERASGHDGREDRESAQPAVGGYEGGKGAVGAPGHERAGAVFGGGDEGAAVEGGFG